MVTDESGYEGLEQRTGLFEAGVGVDLDEPELAGGVDHEVVAEELVLELLGGGRQLVARALDGQLHDLLHPLHDLVTHRDFDALHL